MAKQVMFTVTNYNISSFTYKAGSMNLLSYAISRQKGIYFKKFNYPNLVILPVKYASFDAVAAEKNINLKWITEEENNNHHFEVERSFDGTNFTTAGLVLDGFEDGASKTYMFKEAVVEGCTIIYYRLKQVGYDAKVTYSNMLTVRLEAKTGISVETSPNPFTENINIRFTAVANGIAEMLLTNTNGQVVMTRQFSVTKGHNNLLVNNLGALSNTVYIATLKLNGVVVGSQKLVKSK